MVVPRQQNTSCTRGKSAIWARRSKLTTRCSSFLWASGSSRRASTVTRTYAGFSSSRRSTWPPTSPDAPATRAVREEAAAGVGVGMGVTRSAPYREQHAHEDEIRELITRVEHPRGDRLLREHVRSEPDGGGEPEPGEEAEPQPLRQGGRIRIRREQRHHVGRDQKTQHRDGVRPGHSLPLHLFELLGRVALSGHPLLGEQDRGIPHGAEDKGQDCGDDYGEDIDIGGRHGRSFAIGAKLRRLGSLASVGPASQAGPRVHQHAGQPHRAADELVLVQEAERPEEVVPVVLAAADQRQLFGAGVLHVDRNVPEVLSDPPERDHRRVAVAPTPEVRHEDRRHEKLHQRSAEEADELPECAEQGMSELVDGEVEAVEPAVMPRVENQERTVHREHGGEAEARAPLRYGVTRFERKLPVMIGFPPAAGRISKVPLSESPRTLPVATVTTSALAAMLW